MRRGSITQPRRKRRLWREASPCANRRLARKTPQCRNTPLNPHKTNSARHLAGIETNSTFRYFQAAEPSEQLALSLRNNEFASVGRHRKADVKGGSQPFRGLRLETDVAARQTARRSGRTRSSWKRSQGPRVGESVPVVTVPIVVPAREAGLRLFGCHFWGRYPRPGRFYHATSSTFAGLDRLRHSFHAVGRPGAVRVARTIRQSCAFPRHQAEAEFGAIAANFQGTDESGVHSASGSECSLASQGGGDGTVTKAVRENGIRPGSAGSTSQSFGGPRSIRRQRGRAPSSARSAVQNRNRESDASWGSSIVRPVEQNSTCTRAGGGSAVDSNRKQRIGNSRT